MSKPLKRPTLDDVKDEIDECLRVTSKRTSRKYRAAIERARDLIDYLENVHVFQLEFDEKDAKRDERRARASKRSNTAKAGAK